MGPIWEPHMGLRWDLQHGSMWYPHGQIHLGHKWEPYGSYSGFAQVAHVQPTFVE